MVTALGLTLAAGPALAQAKSPPEDIAAERKTYTDAPTPTPLRPATAKSSSPTDLPPPNIFAEPRRTPFMAASARPAGSTDTREFRSIVEREAANFGLPRELVDAVMAVESRHNPNAVGADGEIGLMQVRPSTARLMAFDGTDADLAIPAVNIHYGVQYLAGAWRLAGRDICTATMKYRAGHGETRFSFRSVDYCLKVRAHLAAQGYPVTGSVPKPTFGFATPGGGAKRGKTGQLNLALLNMQLREMTERAGFRVVRQ